MLTQKYKQQQQQVRVQTSESNYLNGMHFSDAPLAEGYSKVLVNWDIDPTTGKLTPRKSLCTTHAITNAGEGYYGNLNQQGYYNIHNVRYTHVSPKNDSAAIQRNVNAEKHLLGIVYNNYPGQYDEPNYENQLMLFDMLVEKNAALNFTKIQAIRNGVSTKHLPHTINNVGIHNNKDLMPVYKNLFNKPVGAFAFNSNYYTFVQTYRKANISDFKSIGVFDRMSDLCEQYRYRQKKGTPYNYFIYNTGDNLLAYQVYYFDIDGYAQPIASNGYDTQALAEEKLRAVIAHLQTNESYPSELNHTYYITQSDLIRRDKGVLCYTKLGQDILPDDELLDETINKTTIVPDKHYVCILNPQKLNPTEAASWGYNMLLEDPYAFSCEKTAANTITILGILPYDDTGKISLTPKKNQSITLKAYYRAPEEYHSSIKNGTYYATAKQYITVDEEKRNPKTKDELDTYVTTTTDYKYGDWWYCSEEDTYYMVMPGTDLTTKRLALFGKSKPAASVQLAPTLPKEEPNKIRVRWQIRTVNSSDWVDLYNEEVLLDAKQDPFTVTTTMSSEELLVKFTITDTLDVTEFGDEYVLTTNTIGLSLVSDELSTALNLKPIKYDLSTCIGIREWQQRLVIWGVEDAPNTVFISDVNNPAFFPYPNNIDVFPDPVRAVYNYGEELLVLTASALYRLSWDTEGLIWTHKLVQQNLSISEADIPMCCVIKNMFFFKSGEYYYMMVPKSSSSIAGETTIAPISRPIEGLLNNFHNEVRDILEDIIGESGSMEFLPYCLCNYFVTKSDTKVILNFVYNSREIQYLHQLKTFREDLGHSEHIEWYVANRKDYVLNLDFLLNVQLIYDTDTRNWNIRIFETSEMLAPIEDIVLHQDEYVYLHNVTLTRGSSTIPSYGLGICEFINIRQNLTNWANQEILKNRDNWGVPILTQSYVVTRDQQCKDMLLTKWGGGDWKGYIDWNNNHKFDPEEYQNTAYQYGISEPDDTYTSSEGVKDLEGNTVTHTYTIKHSIINNYQYLDTGNRDINVDMKKRFREFQLRIKNHNASSLGFYTSFLVDGSLRRDLQKFSPRYITDSSTGEAVIVIERTIDSSHINFIPEYKTTRVDKIIVPERMLQDDGELNPTTLAETDIDNWVVEQSAFPGRTLWKIRVGISGKGYTPRAKLLSTNLRNFEVLGHSWVYRTMHGR